MFEIVQFITSIKLLESAGLQNGILFISVQLSLMSRRLLIKIRQVIPLLVVPCVQAHCGVPVAAIAKRGLEDILYKYIPVQVEADVVVYHLCLENRSLSGFGSRRYLD